MLYLLFWFAVFAFGLLYLKLLPWYQAANRFWLHLPVVWIGKGSELPQLLLKCQKLEGSDGTLFSSTSLHGCTGETTKPYCALGDHSCLYCSSKLVATLEEQMVLSVANTGLIGHLILHFWQLESYSMEVNLNRLMAFRHLTLQDLSIVSNPTTQLPCNVDVIHFQYWRLWDMNY